MPFLRDFDQIVGQNPTVSDERKEIMMESSRMPTSSLSERIKALETAGIIDSFVKKRVPPYAAAAAAVGSTLQEANGNLQIADPATNKPATKIYRNPSSGFHAQPNHLAASSTTNLHSSSSRESLASNEAAPGGLASNLYRSTSVDSIENELPGPTNTSNNELPSSFQNELIDRIKSLRKVSGGVKDPASASTGEIPISIPLDSVNRISISSASPSPAAKPGESNSSSSLSSSINKAHDTAEDLYKTSFVIYPGAESSTPKHRINSHSPIATLDFKIPIPAATIGHQPITTSNKTIIHIDSQFTTSASSPASYSDLPYAKSTGPFVEETALHSTQNNLPNNRSQLLIFNSEYTRGMNNQNFHTEHFNCFNCSQSLTGSRYVLKDEHPYCIKCYETLFANSCKECNKKIGTDSKDLSYKDQHWHEKCFFCHVCKIPLVDKPFGSKNDALYCGECYNQAFASRCDKCAQIFKPGMKKMEYKGQQFHENCFLCFTCASPIGTKSFIPKENKIFCVPCYEQAYATKCAKCVKVISQGGVSYKNNPYHRECFSCTNCQQSLAGQRFTSRDDHPYCSECFGKLFAKKCFSCHNPITVNPSLPPNDDQDGIGGTKYISFEDRHWHNECFVCNQCRSSLVGRGFLTDAMDILCPECGRN